MDKIYQDENNNFQGYKEDGRVKREILSEFKVVSLEEWKREFPQYIISGK